MSNSPFAPTDEQKAVIEHSGSAFISACPGAGKTQVLVERARQELRSSSTGKGLAFLSFTNAAISELKSRLQSESLLSSPPFPHYVGTFDTFLWQFFVAPFGIPGHPSPPHIIPDIEERTVAPQYKRPLPLSCFESSTGQFITEKARKSGFDVMADPDLTAKYEAAARRTRERFVGLGELGFGDVRSLVRKHLANRDLSGKLSAALAARFREIVVDEAQDCNPEDIEIITWLRTAGIVTKIICDPHQSIYEFRGGVTDQLFALRDSFPPTERLKMSGNFRSNRNICKAIAAFRAPDEQLATDQPLGRVADDATHIHILSYPGKSVPLSVGEKFNELVHACKLDPIDCPVISSTKEAACNAVGQATDSKAQHITLRLGLAVSAFHGGTEVNARKQALDGLHKIVLELSGTLGENTYHQHLKVEGLKPEDWRPSILDLMKILRYNSDWHTDSDAWLAQARTVLSPYLATGTGSIAQNLKKHQDLHKILATKPLTALTPGTIHSVKGMQFPGVCVVLSTTTCKEIIDYLSTGQPTARAESARKLYVAASRAERLLVIAVPKSQGDRLVQHIEKTGAQIIKCALS
jgi:superfamily I DNA/RNA helicase